MALTVGTRLGPYEITALIGVGGMGEVYRARDGTLQRDVALKILPESFATDPERLARFRREAQVLASLNHPHIGAIYGFEESTDTHALVLELVEGPTLADRIAQGAVPVDDVLPIARQIAEALEAAHEQRIIHRDLKPANIKITPEGKIKVLDFGLAKVSVTDGSGLDISHAPTMTATVFREGMIVGTPAYMSPEQARGQMIDKRTDIWAFGCIVYEMLTGCTAFAGETLSDTIAAILDREPNWRALPRQTPTTVRRLLQRCLEKDANRRLRDIGDAGIELEDMLSAIQRLKPKTDVARVRTPWWLAGTALAAVVGILALVASSLVSPGARALTEQDTIVLADFDNTTGEPVFDGALKVALAVALEQSPFLKVFPDDRARDTLRLMQRSPDERITRPLAREIASREQLKALLAGSIGSLGRNYVIALEAINAETGDVMARQQVEAAGKEQVLTSLGAATSKMREKLGESLASVHQFDVPLARATTPSLDALHAYSLALSGGVQVPLLEGIPQLQRAIELDPAFAMAHAFLSSVYANTGQSSLAPTVARRAFELRDRVSERERFFISWRYYRDALQDWEKALRLAQSWTATYPREAFAFNSLGSAFVRLGRFEQSVAPFREVIRLDPKFVPAYGNLSASLLQLNRYAEARGILKEAADRQLEFIGARRISYLLAFVEGDSTRMALDLASSIGPGQTNGAFGWQAHTSAFSGRAMAAHDQFRRGIQMSLQGNFRQVAAELTMEDAEIHAIVGQCGEARREVPGGLELSRDNTTLERASRVLALCGAESDALSISNELAKGFPGATNTNRVSLPVTAAAVAMGRGEPARALALLEPVRPYDHATFAEFWPAYLRGQAYLQVKDGRAAAGEFQSIVDHRGEVPVSVLYPLAHLGLARAAALTNDTDKARRSYDAFFTLWKEADSDLQPLKDARVQYSRLPKTRRPEETTHLPTR